METFDLRETIIPFSLLQINNHFQRMKPGEVIEILCLDASIEQDLKRILPRLAYEAHSIVRNAVGPTEFAIHLRKI